MTATIISSSGKFKPYTIADVISVQKLFNGVNSIVVMVFMDDDREIKVTEYTSDDVKISLDVC